MVFQIYEAVTQQAFCERNEWPENTGVALEDLLVDCQEKGE
jgi:hypothetical protein